MESWLRSLGHHQRLLNAGHYYDIITAQSLSVLKPLIGAGMTRVIGARGFGAPCLLFPELVRPFLLPPQLNVNVAIRQALLPPHGNRLLGEALSHLLVVMSLYLHQPASTFW